MKVYSADVVENELKNIGSRRYITGFDGLRVLALLGVIFYHLRPFAVPGGYLGVPIFFAVSGYLITDIFIQEWDHTGHIKLGSFYLRRLRRLYPTLVVVLVTSTAYMTLFAHDLMSHIRSIIITNLTFVYNWWLVGNGQSYFDRYNGESPFTHLWYLSVLAQYYFIWPLLLIILLKIYENRRGQAAGILLGLSIISTMVMAILYHPSLVNRVYYGTDTRVAPFLLGAALSFIWPSTRLKKSTNLKRNAVANLLGLIGLIVMLIAFFEMPGTGAFPYYGGIFLFSLMSVFMIAIIANPSFIWNRLLTNPVFKWLGSRSYGIYMYQLPVMVFYEQKVTKIAEHPVINLVVPLLIILVISEFSYRFIEIPLAKFDYRKTWKVLMDMFTTKVRARQIGTLISLLVCFIALFGAMSAPEKVSQKTDALKSELAKNSKKTSKKNEAALKRQKAANHAQKIKPEAKLSNEEQKVAQKYHLTNDEMKFAVNVPLTGVGDSVLEDTATNLQEVFKTAYMSAKVGRQGSAAPDLIRELDSEGKLSQNVLINLGANGAISQGNIADIEKAVGSRRHIFWVNVHIPTQAWEGQVNRALQKAERKYSNFTVIDWNTPAKDHDDWFYGDNVHPNPHGSVEYTSIITKEIVQNLNK